MPKLPRSVKDSRNRSRAASDGGANGKAKGKAKNGAGNGKAKKGDGAPGNGTSSSAAAGGAKQGNGALPKGARAGDSAVAGAGFEHRPVDQAEASGGSGAVTATIELNDFERGLLSDLFAVIEEHAGESVSPIDRGKI